VSLVAHDDGRLAEPARSAFADAELVMVSAASAWEAGIKVQLGRLQIPGSFESGVVASGFEKRPIGFSHAETAARLPPHHRDPFDRMLVAQALIESLTLVTHDRRIEPYDLPVLWV
jgi:PIN domain nuclease of toxin-antitoxin system